MDTRASLLAAVEDVKGVTVRSQVENGGQLTDSIDSLDLLEILIAFDERAGVVTDPQDLPATFESFDAVVDRLTMIHAAH